MASTKLTNWMREAIAKAVVQHRFNEPAKALIERRAAFAAKVYDDIYPPAHQAKMKALPSGWLPESDDIGAQFGSGHGFTKVTFSGAIYGAVARALTDAIEPVARRVISDHARGCVRVYEGTHPLAVEYEALKEDAASLAGEIDAAERQAKAAINSASTVSGLIKLWPEIEPFALKHETAERPSLPALPVEQLNALFKLPASEAA